MNCSVKRLGKLVSGNDSDKVKVELELNVMYCFVVNTFSCYNVFVISSL